MKPIVGSAWAGAVLFGCVDPAMSNAGAAIGGLFGSLYILYHFFYPRRL